MYNQQISTNKPWWEYPKGDVGPALQGHIEYLRTRYNSRSEKNLTHLRLYGQSDVFGLNEDVVSMLRNRNRLRINIIRQVVEAGQAKVAKHKPKARFLTENGNSVKQKNAKKLEKYCSGVAYNDDHWAKSNTEFIHAAVFGTTARKFFIDDDGNPASETVLIENIKVDESEIAISTDGNPLALYQEDFVNISTLKKKYPKYKNELEAAGVVHHAFFAASDLKDMARVTEGWKLPSSKNAKDGRHVITCGRLTLHDEPYTCEEFPFEFYKFYPNILGFFGQGIPERLMSLQIEINKLLKDIHDIIHLGCVPKIFAPVGAITKSQLNNAIGTVVEFMGNTAPIQAQLMNVPQELFVQLEKLINFAFEEVGLSILSAQSEKPAGLNSGKALREFSDIESDRFSIMSERWEDYHMRCFQKYLMTAEMAAEEYPALETKALDDEGYEIINLKDIDIKDLDFVVRSYPVNLLSDRPAHRLADVRDLIDTGLITPEEGKELLNFPDLKRHMNMTMAPSKFIQNAIDTILEKGIYLPPDQFQDLELGVKMFNQAINYYRTVDVPPETLFLLEQWISDALAITTQQEQEMQEQQMAMQLQQQQLGGMNGATIAADPAIVGDAGIA